jgi:hypothetical protein
MKTTRLALILIALSGVAFATTSKANLTLVDTYKDTPENTDHILQVAGVKLGDPNLIDLLRVENTDGSPAGSPFTITYPSSGIANISWDLTGTGFTLSGVYIFGGSRGANLYQVTDAAQMISGSATINTPAAGNSGNFAGISHILFLGDTAPVPEPSSIILLSLGAAGFVAWRTRRA